MIANMIAFMIALMIAYMIAFMIDCFAQLGTGVSSVGWDISSLKDGEYEFVIHVGCGTSKSLIPSASVTFSSIAKLVLDRSTPIEYAQHARPAGPYYPGDDISIAFNEAIVSSGVTVTAKVSYGTTLNQNDLLVSYSDNSVFLDFSPSMSVLV
jgi:hypothetical protein